MKSAGEIALQAEIELLEKILIEFKEHDYETISHVNGHIHTLISISKNALELTKVQKESLGE